MNWASDTVSVLIEISSVRAAMSGNAGSAAAANEATREKEHTPKTIKRFGCLVDRRIGFSKAQDYAIGRTGDHRSSSPSIGSGHSTSLRSGGFGAEFFA